MRNNYQWAAIAVAVPMLLATTTSSFATPQDKSAESQPQATLAASPAEPVDLQEDVSVVLQLDDGSEMMDLIHEEQETVTSVKYSHSGSGGGLAARVKDIAVKYLGTPYKWGGTTPAAFDCSGFTKYVLNSLGIRLPRTAREQYKAGTPVKAGELKAGDLVFFDMRKGYVSHVGLYLGDGTFIHASTPATGVRMDKLANQAYKKYFVGARRFS